MHTSVVHSSSWLMCPLWIWYALAMHLVYHWCSCYESDIDSCVHRLCVRVFVSHSWCCCLGCIHYAFMYASAMQSRTVMNVLCNRFCNAYFRHLLCICCAFMYASLMHACICCAVVMPSSVHLLWVCCASIMFPCMHLSCTCTSVKHILGISVAFCHAPNMHLLCVWYGMLCIHARISYAFMYPSWICHSLAMHVVHH